MKKYVFVLVALISINGFCAVEKSGRVSNVQIWGGIAKAAICSGENSCTSFWVSLSEVNGQSVLSLWLAAKMSGNKVYVQGYEPDNENHPYYGASKFYGMSLKSE